MGLFKELIFQDLKNSNRKLFYKNLLLSNCIFFLSVIYIIIILIKGSLLIKITLKRSEINIGLFLLYFIVIFSVLDLTLKLLFTQIRISNVYPYLRYNIPRKKLANYVILMNHLNFRNFIGLLFLIPVIIIGNDFIDAFNLFSILLSLFVIVIFNNYVSMISNLMRLKFHFLILIPILFSLFIFVAQKMGIVNPLIISHEIFQTNKLFFILSVSLLSGFSHMFLEKELLKMFYLN
jgi:hypothetical protein